MLFNYLSLAAYLYLNGVGLGMNLRKNTIQTYAKKILD